jgi:hypothetical protein
VLAEIRTEYNYEATLLNKPVRLFALYVYGYHLPSSAFLIVSSFALNVNLSRLSPLLLLLLLWLYSPLLGLGLSFSFLILYPIGLLGLGISRYLHTGYHKHRINAHNTHIHASRGIRTQDPSVRASEYSSCLRPRGHCDRPPSAALSLLFPFAVYVSMHKYVCLMKKL